MDFTRENLGSAYRHSIGASPDCGPDDKPAAHRFLTRIEAALEQGGWTKAENLRLNIMRRRWRLRAQGKDCRFLLMGTQSGSTPVHLQSQLKNMKIIEEMKETLHGAETRK